MRLTITLLVIASLLIFSAESKSAEEWKSRTVYQIMVDRFARSDGSTFPCPNLSNYCGGTWKGIQAKLDYIQGLGFDAIWIGPIVKNTPGGYHGYWLQDLYQVNEHHGTEQDLMNLVNEAHRRGIWVMVDVVANHVGPVGYNYSSIAQFNSPEHYHDCRICPPDCIIANWRNQPEVEHCRLAGLPDLNQTNPYVHKTLVDWLKSVVSKYSLDGIRVDTVVEVPKPFWAVFNEASGVFQMGEVFDGDVDYLASYQPPVEGLLSYPMYFTMKDVWAYRQSMYKLRDMVNIYQAKIRDPDAFGTFIDNHDNARFLSIQSDPNLYRNALIYTLFSRGIPFVYYGSEQGFSGGIDPRNRETLWTTGYPTTSDYYIFIRNLVHWRKQHRVWEHPQVERYVDDHIYCWTRGNVFIATTNTGSNGPIVDRIISYHPYSVGTKLCNLFWEGDCVTVTSSGFQLVLLRGEAKIFVPA